MSRSRRRLLIAAAGAGALLALGMTACTSTAGSGNLPGSAAASSSAMPAPGGAARVALPAGVVPTWIWPYTPLASANNYNVEGFQMLMYRPLYMFGDNGSSVALNDQLSVAGVPVYSDEGKTVTITMKGWKWSDGETTDASDVVFWLNMMKAEPGNYYGYVAGQLPDNLVSYHALGADTVVLHLKSAVSSIWFTYNQLSEITPMPTAWDVASEGAKAGSGGCAADTAADKWAKCIAVYRFLTAQANDASSYAANPLWKVVDGPWKLSSFSTAVSGPVASFVPNAAYSGRPKPQLASFTYYAYTDDTSEYSALKSGKLDVGDVPAQVLSPVSGRQVLPSTSPLGSGFVLSATFAFAIQYLQINYDSPALGPAFKQLYVRQAFQELVDQEGIIKSAYRGYGYPTSGGVPNLPANPWAATVQDANGGQGPYPFSVSHAMALLTSHGWKEVSGVMTCETPAVCGAGIKAGTQLSLSMDYTQGIPPLQDEVTIIKSDLAPAGVKLTLVPQPLSTIIGESASCTLTWASCKWDILDFGGWSFGDPDFEPTGDPLFGSGGSANGGRYSDATEDKLIGLTHTSDSLAVFRQYATYTADQVPVIWVPSAYSVLAVSRSLANVGNSPLSTFLPEFWFFTR